VDTADILVFRRDPEPQEDCRSLTCTVILALACPGGQAGANLAELIEGAQRRRPARPMGSGKLWRQRRFKEIVANMNKNISWT
jgi:hypothetical protein